MKKKFFIIFLILTNYIIAFSQNEQSYHSLFLGPNISTFGISNPISENKDFQSFKDPKIGFSGGYNYTLGIGNHFNVSGGISYQYLQTEFVRKHFENTINGDPSNRKMSEKLQLSRLVVPLKIDYRFIQKENLVCYATTGAEIIMMNKAKREVDYTIPSTPGNSISGTYYGTSNLMFGENENSLGAAFIIGAGTMFNFIDRRFIVELDFITDISKSKITTLHNIEYDTYFFGKFKSFQLTLGYPFAFKHKAK